MASVASPNGGFDFDMDAAATSNKTNQKTPLHESERSDETASETCCSDDDGDDSSCSSDSDSSCDDESSSSSSSGWGDGELDLLEQEILGFACQSGKQPVVVKRRNSSHQNQSPALQAMKTKTPRKMSLPSLPTQLMQRMEEANSAGHSYFQAPTQTAATRDACDADEQGNLKPDLHLKQHILEGLYAANLKSADWESYFMPVNAQRIAAHCLTVSRALRKMDLTKLRKLLHEGMRFDGCNQHGESMMHLACRLGNTQLVDFVMTEAKVSVRVKDDAGRTPLHDACWQRHPNFDIIRRLIEDSPQLLFLEDHRGYTALNYVPKQTWGDWCAFLDQNKLFFRQQVHAFGFQRTTDRLNETEERMNKLKERMQQFVGDA